MTSAHRFDAAQTLFRRQGGMLRTAEALRAGVHPRTLYAMRDAGVVERLSRGLYRLSSLPPLTHPDLVIVSRRVPHGVICLLSALAFHELTTQIPHEVYLAIAQGAEPPRIDYPPLRVCWFSGWMFSEGIDTVAVDGVGIRVYSPEKTLVDCFRYRSTLGLETVLEALKCYLVRKPVQVDTLLRYARVCRVETVIRPYLEALL